MPLSVRKLYTMYSQNVHHLKPTLVNKQPLFTQHSSHNTTWFRVMGDACRLRKINEILFGKTIILQVFPHGFSQAPGKAANDIACITEDIMIR